MIVKGDIYYNITKMCYYDIKCVVLMVSKEEEKEARFVCACSNSFFSCKDCCRDYLECEAWTMFLVDGKKLFKYKLRDLKLKLKEYVRVVFSYC